MLLVSVTISLASCSVDDNAILVVDDKPFTFDSEIDYSVNPGDDFYQYAIGKWLNSSNPSPSIFKQMVLKNRKLKDDMLTTSSDPLMVYLRNQANETMTDDSKNKALLNERLQMLEQITTGDQLYKAFQDLYYLGYGTLFRLTPHICCGRKSSSLLLPGGMTESIIVAAEVMNKSKMEQDVKAYCSYLKSFGFSDERIEQIIKHATEIETLEMEAYVPSFEFLHRPVKRRATLSDEDLEKEMKVMALIGITRKDEQEDRYGHVSDEIAALSVRFADAYKSQEEVTVFRDYMIYNVMAQDLHFVPSINPETTILDMMKSALQYSRYYLYRLATETYGHDVYKQECNDITERMRKTFIKRLEKLDWMTDVTKAEARKKAEAMRFFIGYPDKWNDQYTPTVDGDCLLASATQLRQNAVSIINDLRGKNFDDVAWDTYVIQGQYTTTQAFYAPDANALVILPGYISKPHFDNEMSKASLYAFSTAIAHEFCHGFDSEGAEFDTDGNIRDWWAAADKAAFKAKQQIMIELFEQLEAYPGQKANGTNTLAENMADYGGMELTLDCYKQLLAEQGFKGKQYDEQIKKFFLTYVHDWKDEVELSIDALKSQYLYDVHSAPHNRVNGILRLMDDWYRLYDVKPTDKLYVAPADRVKIW